jgi:hypothetical protein
MSESSIDRVRISKEARTGKPSGVAPSWIPPVLRRFYDFTRKMAHSFSGELKIEKKEEREEELVKVVVKSFKGTV